MIYFQQQKNARAQNGKNVRNKRRMISHFKKD